MHAAFSFNREFDFVRLDGLRRATGRPPHEWDIYIIKELLDNALDADETLWQHDYTQHPAISVTIEYIPVPELQSQQFFIEVNNRATFPVGQISDIFNTGWYTSRKAFIKGVTRGALGNALKTLLGIPYVLRNRLLADDWKPAFNPMSIRCGTTEYLPQYIVDSLGQQVQFACPTNQRKPVNGTSISIGIDQFKQEQPRTLEDIKALAQQYHLCNPHAHISWFVTLDGNEWEEEYLPDPTWTDKFHGTAPIHWYSFTTFQDVVGALYRKPHDDGQDGQISLDEVSRCFMSHADIEAIKDKCHLEESFAVSDIEGKAGLHLYRTFLQHSPRFDPASLGAIGPEHVSSLLKRAFAIEGEIFYRNKASHDPNVPFVIEAAVAYLKTGKRQLWTAMNFSPTYSDPFQNRYLTAPILSAEPVLGLRGLLDSYGLLEVTPSLVFLHVICPNIEHHEFSKTEINHLPFKEDIGALLDGLLTELRHYREAEDLQLEETLSKVMATILSAINENERFTLQQLLAQVRANLQHYPSYAPWLRRVDAPSQLQRYVASYLRSNTTLAQSLAQPPIGTLTIPLHPDRHFQLAVEHITQATLEKYAINKILYIQEPDLEAVALENNWLCQMDMALLHNPQRAEKMSDVLLACFLKCDLPIMIWHNADDTGQGLMAQIKNWLYEYHVSIDRLIDLGLNSGLDQLTHLLAMMPGEQTRWLQNRFNELHIPVKAVPGDQDIRQDMIKHLEQRFLGSMMEHFRMDLADIFTDLYQELSLIEAVNNRQLDVELKQELANPGCPDSYDNVVEKVGDAFFDEIVHLHRAAMQRYMSHIYLKKM